MKINNNTIPLWILAITLFSACANKITNTATKEFIHGNGHFSKAVTVSANNVKTIYISGLTGDGDNLEAQTRSTFANIKIELEAAGASLKDIVKINTYIVNYKPEDIEVFRKVRKEILGEKDMPASTVVGVQALAVTDKTIEIEVIAVLNITSKK